MKNLILCIILCFFPLTAWSHPGKTDHYGGHKCLKGCEAWGLYYEEYHLHDKDGRPIRVNQRKKSRRSEPISEVSITPETTALQVDPPVTQVVTTYRYVTNVYEENVFQSNPYLFVLLVLLLLLLILRMNRKKGRD